MAHRRCRPPISRGALAGPGCLRVRTCLQPLAVGPHLFHAICAALPLAAFRDTIARGLVGSSPNRSAMIALRRRAVVGSIPRLLRSPCAPGGHLRPAREVAAISTRLP